MPPPETSKKLVPKLRSIITSTSAIVMAGKERTIRNDVTSVIQVNTGRRIIVMPGRAHVDDRDDEVQRRGDRGDAEELQAHHPEIDRVLGMNCFEVSGA